MSGYVVGLTLRRLPVEDHGQLLVALALAEQSDSEGNGVYPSVDLVAVETRLSRRAVQYKISELVELGYIVLVERGGGRNRPNRWRIDVDWLARQHDRVAAMRVEKNTKSHHDVNGARHAPFPIVDKPPVDKPPAKGKNVQKACTNGAQTGAPNPPTHCPVGKPPPLDELIEAALWLAASGSNPPRSRRAYSIGIRRRLASKVDADDVAVWRRWLVHLEMQQQIQAGQEGDGAR
jgi:hypothetical protein